MERIVIFDSGLGGITALIDALKAMPKEHFIYYGDTKHVPYGTKDAVEIRTYLDEMMTFVAPYRPKAVLLACNTATVAAAAYLREKYPIPIIGMEPAVKPAIIGDIDNKRILVLSTEGTSRSRRLQSLVKRFDNEHLVDILPLPNLVDFAERLEFHSPEVKSDLEAILASYDMNDYHSIVLGCTHFIWYKDLFQEMLPEHITILDGNQATIKQLMRKLGDHIQIEGAGSLNIHFTNPMNDSVFEFLQTTLPVDFEPLQARDHE